jgi:hypothetical protein
MFWNMNTKLKLKILNYASWLQIVLDILNFKILFHMKKTCLGQCFYLISVVEASLVHISKEN